MHEKRAQEEKSWSLYQARTLYFFDKGSLYLCSEEYGSFSLPEELGHYQKDSGFFSLKLQYFIPSQTLCASNERWFIREKLEHAVFRIDCLFIIR